VKINWIYWVIHGPDGTSYSQGRGVIMTDDGRGWQLPEAAQKEKRLSQEV
jgi:hypothetical protein